MIYDLMEYAKRKKITSEVGFCEREVRWAVLIERGKIELVPLFSKENRSGRLFKRCPYLSQPELKNGGGTRHFLCDTTAAVFGHYEKDDDGKGERQHRKFLDLHLNRAKGVKRLAPIQDLLSDKKAIAAMLLRLKEDKVKPSDTITFCVNGKWVLDEDFWHEFWREEHGRISSERSSFDDGEGQKCMISVGSGALIIPAKTHHTVKLTDIGGNSTGSKLCCFDKSAFESYGLAQGQNAAVSEEEAALYRNALQHVIDQAVKLYNLKVCYWFSKDIPPERNPFSMLLTGSDEETTAAEAESNARETLNALQSGKYPDDLRAEYYMFHLAVSGPRIVIRKNTKGLFKTLVNNIKLWFDDTQIVGPTGFMYGYRKPTSLLYSLFVPEAPTKMVTEYIPNIATQVIWDAATTGSPLSDIFYHKAIRGIESDMYAGKLDSRKAKCDPRKFMVLKAYLIRKQRRKEQMENRKLPEKDRKEAEPCLGPQLNENHPDAAYQCGRFLALMDDLYQIAMKQSDMNGVSIRYWGGFMSLPFMTFGALCRSSNIYLNKLSKGDKAGLASILQARIAEVINKIDSTKLARFDSTQCGMFGFGYYHQKAYMVQQRIAARAARTGKSGANEDADQPDALVAAEEQE